MDKIPGHSPCLNYSYLRGYAPHLTWLLLQRAKTPVCHAGHLVRLAYRYILLLHPKGWSQNRVKIFYLHNVKIAPLTPSLPSIFTVEFSSADSYDNCGQETWYVIEGKATYYPHIR